MAFICTLDDDTDYQFFPNGRASAVTVRVGYDPDEKANWFVVVGLDVTAGGDLEYYFRLLRVDAPTREETSYNSGRDTAFIIIGEDRKKVLCAAMHATVMLLSRAKPERVFRVTYDSDPPDAALEKHHMISTFFIRCGYRVSRYNEFRGQRMWWMERDEKAVVDADANACFDPHEDGGFHDGPRHTDTSDAGDGGSDSGISESLALKP
jgi:hypothetical protein